LITAAIASSALAHAADGNSDAGWSFEPLAGTMLGLSIILYSLGRTRMSNVQRRAVAPAWRVASYCGAVGILVLALFSPLDALADEKFAWHMAQHLMLMLGAAPLLALANTHLVSLFALPLSLRRVVGRYVSGAPGMRQAGTHRFSPLIAAVIFAAGLWLWHAPRMYDGALANPALHTFEHLTFLVTSAVFWRMVSNAGDRRLDLGSAILLTVLVGLQANLLALLLVLAPSPIYSAYAANDLHDQQIGGVLMLGPASLIFLGASVRAIFRFVQAGPTAARAPEGFRKTLRDTWPGQPTWNVCRSREEDDRNSSESVLSGNKP
jgi:cytochrome c oxidase assembly factor CtaG